MRAADVLLLPVDEEEKENRADFKSVALCGDAVGGYEQLVLEACWALAYLGELDAAFRLTIAFCKRFIEATGLRFWACY